MPDSPPPRRGPRVDCFEELFTRAVGGEAVAALTARLLRERGVADVEAAVLAAARAESEVLARQRHGPRVTLLLVAVQVADLLELPAGAAGAVADAEVEAEHLLLRPAPAALQRLEAARAGGSPVTFTGRTLLPAEAVEQLLDRHGLRRAGDVLELSAEAPRPGAGPAASSTRYERTLERAATATGGASSLLAGASRRTRLVMAAEAPGVAAPLVEVAAGVAGPVLSGYVLWALRRAQAAGCRRVYFVSRDGEVLLRMARPLAGALGLDLDLRYLEGNRRTWLLPGMTTVDVERVLAVAGRGDVTTVRDLLEWVRLDPEDLAGALSGAGFPAASWDAALTQEQQAALLQVLGHPDVAPVVEDAAARATESAALYLRQVGLLDGEPYAIVDMEGHGNVGRMLAPLAEKVGGSAPAVELYFALVSPAPAEGRTPLGYMYDDARGTGVVRREGDVYVALEVFTAGSHGQVQRYETVDGTARAVMAQERNEEVLAWGLGDMRRVLDVFAEELAAVLPLWGSLGDVRRPTWEVLRAFWTRPTAAEVAVWGTFPFPGGEGHYSIAQGFSTHQVVRSLAAKRVRMRRRGTWPAGVRHNAPVHLRALQSAMGRLRPRGQ